MALTMPPCPLTPSFRSPRTSPSCGGRRTRRSWCCRPRSSGWRRSRSPIATAWPGWFGRIRRRRRSGCASSLGCRLDLVDGTSLLCWPTDRPAYARLSSLLTLGKRRAAKAQCRLTLADVEAHAEGQLLALVPPDRPDAGFARLVGDLGGRWRRRLWLVASHAYRRRRCGAARPAGGDRGRRAACRCWRPTTCTTTCPSAASCRTCSPASARNARIAEAGGRLFANAERHLKAPAEMARLFARLPEARSTRTLEIAGALPLLAGRAGLRLPGPGLLDGRTPQQELERRVTWAGAARALPRSAAREGRGRRCAHELELIGELRYAPYFLTVHDIVSFARSQGILCQGRGSAANSAVCYCLGITAVDPAADRPAVRALRLGGARRAARHRRRFRARAARGGDPVHLREVRPRPRRHGGDGDQLPRPSSAIRDVGKALGLIARRARRDWARPSGAGAREGLRDRLAARGRPRPDDRVLRRDAVARPAS